jgi:CubicO group peptidase (beta-lactamase class C family)
MAWASVEGGQSASTVPSETWEEHSDIAASGFTPDGVASVMKMLRDLPTTSLMVVSGGKIAFKYGDVAEVSYLASACKSILSMLFGNYVASGAIDLQRAMGDLGIDDVGGLLPIEKSATIADLLTARSGVYHPASSPGSAKGVPARGSQRPGSYFYYNNWDFNVLRAVFEKLTGKTIFAAFQSDLAGPLQLQDFDPPRQRMLGVEELSRYPAYHFFLSARDMARIGLCHGPAGPVEEQERCAAGVDTGQHEHQGCQFRPYRLLQGWTAWLRVSVVDSAGPSKCRLAPLVSCAWELRAIHSRTSPDRCGHRSPRRGNGRICRGKKPRDGPFFAQGGLGWRVFQKLPTLFFLPGRTRGMTSHECI